MFDNTYENLVGVRDTLANHVRSGATPGLEDLEHALAVVQLVLEKIPKWNPMTEKPEFCGADLQTFGQTWSEPVLAMRKTGTITYGSFVYQKMGHAGSVMVFEAEGGADVAPSDLVGWVYISALDAVTRNRPVQHIAQGSRGPG